MRTLFLAWQNPTSRSWYPIGRLTFDGTNYQFVYIRGALQAKRESRFEALQSFPDLESVYESADLFPLFSNRVLSRSRADYADYVQWLNVPHDQDDPVALLSRSGGRRITDSLEVFPSAEPDESGTYHIHFFAHGLRHLPAASTQRISELRPGEKLLLVHDFQNPRDPGALMLRTSESFDGDLHLVGYCPRYLVNDLFDLLKSRTDYSQVTVERINPPPAPLQLRLMCNLTACWPEEGFRPFASDLYQPIPTDIAAGQA